MYGNAINYNRLREDLKKESYGAFFGGGFGGAIMESIDIEKASDDQLIEIAKRKGMNLSKYQL